MKNLMYALGLIIAAIALMAVFKDSRPTPIQPSSPVKADKTATKNPTPGKTQSQDMISERTALFNGWLADAEHVATQANLPRGISLLNLLKNNHILAGPGRNGSIISLSSKRVPKNYYIVLPLMAKDAVLSPEWADRVHMFQTNPMSAQIDYGQRIIYLWDIQTSPMVRGLIILHEAVHLERLLFDPQFNGQDDTSNISSEVDAYTIETMLFLTYGGQPLLKLAHEQTNALQAKMANESLSALDATRVMPDYGTTLETILGAPINARDYNIRQTLLHLSVSFSLFNRVARNTEDEKAMRHQLIHNMFASVLRLPSQK